MRIFIPIITATLVLGGCTTSYQPMALTGGFSDLRVSDNVYKVTVQGNGYTTEERVEQIALLRASEITLSSGHDRFVVLSDKVEDLSQVASYGTAGIGTITRYGGSIMIEVINKSDARYQTAHDARLISAQLRPILIDEKKKSG